MKTANDQPMTMTMTTKSMMLKMEAKTYSMMKMKMINKTINETFTMKMKMSMTTKSMQQGSDQEGLYSQGDQQGSESYNLYDQEDSDQEGSETNDKDLQERDRDSPAGAGNVSHISLGDYQIQDQEINKCSDEDKDITYNDETIDMAEQQ